MGVASGGLASAGGASAEGVAGPVGRSEDAGSPVCCSSSASLAAFSARSCSASGEFSSAIFSAAFWPSVFSGFSSAPPGFSASPPGFSAASAFPAPDASGGGVSAGAAGGGGAAAAPPPPLLVLAPASPPPSGSSAPAGGVAGVEVPPPLGSGLSKMFGTAGRSTRESTSAIWPGISSRWGRMFSVNW